jgi:hypothetical protein
MFCRKLRCAILISLVSSNLFAAEVRHLPTDQDDDISLMTQGNCLTRSHLFQSSGCRVAGTDAANNYGLYTDLLLKSREDAFETSVRLLNQKLSRSTIERLFARDDFLSFGALVRLGAGFGNTRLEYIPIHILAASRITNPSLPELQYSIANSQVWRLSHLETIEYTSLGLQRINLAADASYHETNIRRFSGNLIDLAAADIEDFSSNAELADGGLNLVARFEAASSYIPDLGIKLSQIGSNQKVKDSKHLEFEDLRGANSRIEIGKNTYRWPLHIHAAVAQPFKGYFTEYSGLDMIGSLSLRLEEVELIASFGAWARSFGFIFSGSSFRAGVQYRNEKQSNEIKLRRYDDLVVSIAASL